MSLYSANISMKFSSVVPGLPKTYRTPRWRSISNSALLACMAASSPWLPAEPAVQGLEPLARELRALAVGDDLALLALHLRDALLQPVRDLQGDGEDAVLVSVEQVPRADGEPAHLHRTPEVHEVDVGVGTATQAAKKWKRRARTSSRSRTLPLVTVPMQPRARWMLLWTSPQYAPTPGGVSRSWRTMMRGGGTSSRARHISKRRRAASGGGGVVARQVAVKA